jgi:hypothetical protein
MCTIPSAAGREIRVGAGREGEQGRDQREAEEEKQGDAEKASHSVIVAKLFGDGVWRGGGGGGPTCFPVSRVKGEGSRIL